MIIAAVLAIMVLYGAGMHMALVIVDKMCEKEVEK